MRHHTTDPAKRAADIARREAEERVFSIETYCQSMEVECELYEEIVMEYQPVLTLSTELP